MTVGYELVKHTTHTNTIIIQQFENKFRTMNDNPNSHLERRRTGYCPMVINTRENFLFAKNCIYYEGWWNGRLTIDLEVLEPENPWKQDLINFLQILGTNGEVEHLTILGQNRPLTPRRIVRMGGSLLREAMTLEPLLCTKDLIINDVDVMEEYDTIGKALKCMPYAKTLTFNNVLFPGDTDFAGWKCIAGAISELSTVIELEIRSVFGNWYGNAENLADMVALFVKDKKLQDLTLHVDGETNLAKSMINLKGAKVWHVYFMRCTVGQYERLEQQYEEKMALLQMLRDNGNYNMYSVMVSDWPGMDKTHEEIEAYLLLNNIGIEEIKTSDNPAVWVEALDKIDDQPDGLSVKHMASHKLVEMKPSMFCPTPTEETTTTAADGSGRSGSTGDETFERPAKVARL